MRTAPDYPGLATSLTFANLLDADEVAELLERRTIAVEAQLSAMNAEMDASLKQSRFQRMHLGRVHLIETEYLIALQRAELDWLRAVVTDIREGRLEWDPAGTGHVHQVRDPEGFSGDLEAGDA